MERRRFLSDALPLSYTAQAVAGIEPAAVGFRSNPRLHHRRKFICV